MEQKSARILQSIMLMLAMTLLLVLALDSPVLADDSDNPAYLTFTGTEFFSIKVNDKEKHWNGKLEYSTDTGDTKTWTEWDGKTTISSNNMLYLRGQGNTVITGEKYNEQFKQYRPYAPYGWVIETTTDDGTVACSGDIRTLLNYLYPNSASMNNSCFAYLFSDCKKLTTAPALPATNLAKSCYYGLFWGCTGLTAAPALPATTLADSCYYGMFSDCTSLTTPPALPASNLQTSCYRNMFSGCTSLMTAPKLDAETMKYCCYYYMFSGCTSLTTAPALPATTLAQSCYTRMFNGCEKLAEAPALPATNLKSCDSCYNGMFYGCTSLKTPPELKAETLSQMCYENMFRDCTGLMTAPKLEATTLAQQCYEGMFWGCTSLVTPPDLPATELKMFCYEHMFHGCTKLMTAPALPAQGMRHYCYLQMFADCTSLKLSKEESNECPMPYRIPSDPDTNATYPPVEKNERDWVSNMFLGTGGTFKGTPDLNTTYYISMAHTHVFDYTVGTGENANTITATCTADKDKCPLYDHTNDKPFTATLTIAAPELTAYGGSGSAEATITDRRCIQGETKVMYRTRNGDTYGDPVETAPTNAGNYKASITLGDVTAYVEYTIDRGDPTANAPTGLTAICGQTLADVTLTNPTGNTDGTWAWEDDTQSVGDAVSPAAKFKATFTPDDESNYKKVEDVEVTVTVIEDLSVSHIYSLTSFSGSLVGIMPEDAEELTYRAAGEASKTGSVTVSDFTVDNDGKVFATLSGGEVGDTVTLPVTIGSANYVDTTVKVIITLTPKNDAGVTILGVPLQAKTYGDADFTLSGNVTEPGSGTGDWKWSVSENSVFRITAEGATASVEILKAGSGTVTATYESDTTVGTETTVSITVNTKTITITAKDQNISVGVTVPTLSGNDLYTVTGLVGEETLTTNPTLAYQKDGSAVTPDNTTVGTYDIVPFGASAGDNYNIIYTNGTLTINKGTQTISANNVTAAYGDTDKKVSARVTDPATGSGELSYAVKEGSTDYIDVDASNGALTIRAVPADKTAYVIVKAAETDDYAETTREVTVTISPAEVTIAAKDQIISIGDAVPILEGEDFYTVAGLVGEDRLTIAPTLAYQKDGIAAIPDNTKEGTYDIVPSGASAGNNYTISYTKGTLTISAKKIQTIRANDLDVTYGDTDKRVSATTTGDGAISYEVMSDSGKYIEVDASTGVLTIKKVPANGKAYVIVRAAETETYVQAVRYVTVYISKARAVPATVTANSFIYDGTERPLVTVDNKTLVGGEMRYSLSSNAAIAPTDGWSASIPVATDVGTYYVWYKVVADAGGNYKDSEPGFVRSEIRDLEEKPDDWNLFEDDSVHEYAVYGINVEGTVENSNKKSVKFYDAEVSGNTITVKLKENLNKGDRKKAAKASNAALEFSLGSEGVVEYILPVCYVKPVFKLSSTSDTIKNGTETVLRTTLLIKSTGGDYIPYDMEDVQVSGTGLSVALDDSDENIEITANAACKGKINIKKPGWDETAPVSLNYKVKATDKDVLKADIGNQKVIDVNSNTSGQALSFDISLNGKTPAKDEVVLTDKKNTGLASISDDGKLVVNYKGGLKDGTYSIPLEAGEAKTNVKIRVSNSALDKIIKLKVKRKLNVVTGQSMIVKPSMKQNLDGGIVSVKVREEDFTADLDSEGLIVIGYDGDTYNANNRKIGTLTLDLEVNDVEDPVTLELKNVTAIKTLPKVSAASVAIPKDSVSAEGKVIGTANILSYVKLANGRLKIIAPENAEIVSPKGFTAKVNANDKTEIDIESLDKASATIKVKLTYKDGLSRNVTVKVKQLKK